MKKSMIASLIVVLLLIPLTLWLGMKLPGRYLIAPYRWMRFRLTRKRRLFGISGSRLLLA